MARFLEYLGHDDMPEYVCLEDISAIVCDKTHPGSSCIYLRSDPESEFTARGAPRDVLMGRIVEL